MFQLIDTPESPLHEVKPGSFIYEWRNALDEDVCKRMIDQFEELKEDQCPGAVGLGDIRPELKRSTDLYLNGEPHWQWADEILYESLQDCLQELGKIHYIFEEAGLEDTGYQIQRSLPGEFYHWHKDLNRHSRKRTLVFIWYLNDMPVLYGGATEFKHQKIAIQPEVGKLVVFPPFWTHVHRACEVFDGVKYICTGWISYEGVVD